jgi:hypothetical protein
MDKTILAEIRSLPEDWHGAGTATADMLSAIHRHCSSLLTKRTSLETGSGKTTLLFSQIFTRHSVYAFDAGGSVSKVRSSPLLKPGVVEFIDGPTQLTLPRANLSEPLDCVLLDGPHGYPFPDLEYYYVYPHLRFGSLLIPDDVHIPTIARMLDILKADPMFEHVEAVGYTAFLRRTDAPMVDPLADDWWKQGYNLSVYEKGKRMAALRATPLGRLFRAVKRTVRELGWDR